MLNFTIILLSVFLNAAAQLFLKNGSEVLNDPNIYENIFSLSTKVFFNPSIISGLACYAISILLWIYALSKVEVSIAYPMISIGFIVNAIAAWYLFSEPLGLFKLIGIFFIIIGVIFISRGI